MKIMRTYLKYVERKGRNMHLEQGHKGGYILWCDETPN